MRVQPHDMATLRGRIAPFDTEGARDVYRRGDFSRSDRVIDLDKRYRWDLFWAANAGTWISTLNYDVNDTHIDTALKAIVPPLGEAPVLDMFTVVGSGSYDADTDTVWMATHSSVVDGSDARLLSPGWNAEGWGTLENENGDRWRDQSLYWDEYVTD